MAETATTIPIDSAHVFDDGRIRIPDDIRDEFNIHNGDMIHAHILINGDIARFMKRLSTRGRLRIPSSIRDTHSIEDGDHIDVEIIL